MKIRKLVLVLAAVIFCITASGQTKQEFSKIDILLVKGEYKKVIDTCTIILATDSLNAEMYYKMGLAYMNLMPDDKSLDYFQKAAALAPENNLYKYMVAKGLFGKGKNSQAKPLFKNLTETDSLNWTYAYYLTTIYIQEAKYDESLEIYNRFYKNDSANYIFIDKIGFALLRKRNYPEAIEMFSKSLTINDKNINALKNISYIYTYTDRIDTAIILLTRAIKIDDTDMDLYARRAALYFSKDYTKRALNDYLKILATGDTTFLSLKRSGIGYSNNLQPKEAIKYFLLATRKDSTDFETLTYLARNYHKLNDFKTSAFYYSKIVNILTPATFQLGYTYINLAEEQKADSLYKEAIDNFLKGQKLGPDMNIDMIVANIYDENLKNTPKAIFYYQRFLDNYKKSNMPFTPDYIATIEKRLNYLKQKQAEVAKK
jgi:tetratricopeptide (TPR) repeat protein